MVSVDDLVGKLCLLALNNKEKVEAKEWRLLGQEQDGSLLFAWLESGEEGDCTNLGLFSYADNSLKMLHTFEEPTNVVQASINFDRTIMGFVTKNPDEDNEGCFVYTPTLLKLTDSENVLCPMHIERSKQIMIQFLHKKHSVLNEKQTDKFLLLIHEECVLQYKLKPLAKEFNIESFLAESLLRVFIWAQWDAVHQTLYYIHYRKPIKSLVEGDDPDPTTLHKVSPTLSGLQFHEDLPHESVLNIPLNLPHLTTTVCNLYEDDTVPLRIHNCSLDLMVLTDSSGIVCICHHYLYQPVQPAKNLEDDDDSPVHFAYSVTVLHQSCVLHCVIPGIPWKEAKTIRPLFKLYDDHMMVFIPGVCTQLLDISMIHEPSNHITTHPLLPEYEISKTCLTPLIKCGKYSVLNLTTLDVIDLHVPTTQLIETFKSETTLDNKLAILHYLLVHQGEMDVAIELISSQVEKPVSLGFPQMLKEFLLGSAYASVQRNLPCDASQLINLLPVSSQPVGCDVETEINGKTVSLSQDALWNASMMLLSPQQRIVPYRVDLWVKLWEILVKNTKGKQRFKPSQVVEKLLVSLVCYQPEALSRSSTPMSPGSSLSLSTTADLSTMKSQSDALPFYETESCTASKQEHIISVNLRELSMHLLKQSTENKMSRFQWQSQTPMHVHAVATRYIAAQLEQSRLLCQILCKAATYDARYEHDKGFVFIDQLPEEKRYILYVVLERYYLAAEAIAFPLPLGFTSFFTFLGYRTLRFNIFLQYVLRHVFELQIDVMKIIMADIDDSKVGIQRKLKLLSLLPRSRAKRLMNQWNHPISLMLRAREHAMNILSGVEGQNSRGQGLQKSKNQLGLAAFPSADRLSPLDTFLDLLTAKASLADLDFGLLIEATVTSTEDFLD